MYILQGEIHIPLGAGPTWKALLILPPITWGLKADKSSTWKKPISGKNSRNPLTVHSYVGIGGICRVFHKGCD